MPIATAIRNRKLLRFSYDGYLRTVEPHCYGIDRKGTYLLRAYQIAGGSESGEFVGWKLFRQDEMVAITVTNDSFAGPRPDYKQGDRAIPNIIAELV
jgi:predicted DNA-binding transcriptional regulator YafY